MLFEAWVGVGTNLGDHAQIIQFVCKSLSSLSGFPIKISPLFQTEPWGVHDQDDYFNCVIGMKIDTDRLCEVALTQGVMTPLDPFFFHTKIGGGELFLKYLQQLEMLQGRRRALEMRWGPRTLDLDLLEISGGLLEDSYYQSSNLTLPHPRLHVRRFVLEPWEVIAPKLFIPALGLSVSELLLQCPDTSWVKRL